MARGRPPKPLALHLLHGTHRKDRHGDKTDDWQPAGPIVKPDDLSPAASATFDRLAEQLSLVLRPTDVPLLAMACELLSLYHRSLEIARTNPCDRAARGAVLGYGAAFDRLAARFGLTPVDRGRLKTIPPAGKPDEYSQFLDRKRARVASRKRD